ncbi:MAG: OmpA family protein [Myxococcota bacterium]
MSRQHIGWRIALAAGLALLLAGCGAAVPAELEQARTEFEDIATGPAHDLAPDAVMDAKAALDRAERAFERYGDDEVTRTRAYVALRRAQLADVQARLTLQRRRVATARRSHEALAGALRGEQARELRGPGETPGEPSPSRAERMKHIQAEARMLDARERLERVASVRDMEEGAILVRLPSESLFAQNASDLLPPAFERLALLAVFIKQLPDRVVRVEVHTDAARLDAWSMALSQERAQVVRGYLVARGIDADRIRATGYGASKPIESSTTMEGREANRRVEVVIESPAEP